MTSSRNIHFKEGTHATSAHNVGLLALLVLLSFALELRACQVPVFRYALERWSTDQYQVIVLHDQPLDAASKHALHALQTASKSKRNQRTVIQVRVVNLSKKDATLDPRLQKLWQSNSDKEPQMLVYYPEANAVGRAEPVYQAALNENNVASLLDSPLRQKLASHLAQGDSAVWIFVPCGDEKKDREAYKRLENQLAEDTKRFELPSAEELEVDERVLKETKVPLRIQFSILTVKLDDPQEQFVIKALLHSEEDLASFDEPLAFPVFGQGRVLYCLVGKGINNDTIRAASSFMAGPCSCQVKNQNPGFDMLLQVDWNKVLGDVLISEPIDKPDRDGRTPTLLTIPPGRK